MTPRTSTRRLTTALALVAAAAAFASGCTSMAGTTTSQEAPGPRPLTPDQKAAIDQGYEATLRRLYEQTPGSRDLVSRAAGVLVFPRVIAAGLIVGGEYGLGELRVGNRVDGYYRSITGSWGLQIGAQSRALVFVFQTQDALNRFKSGSGWSAGLDASVAALQTGINGEIDVNAARAPIVGFVMTNAGLMANLNLEGTKVTRID